MKYTITEAHKAVIEAELAKGKRIELIPVREGVRIIRVDRKSIAEMPEALEKQRDM